MVSLLIDRGADVNFVDEVCICLFLGFGKEGVDFPLLLLTVD